MRRKLIETHRQESPKIGSHSPFDEPILRRYFSLLDCAARTQSGAKEPGRLRGVVQTTFSAESPAIRLLIGLETALVCPRAVTASGPLSPDKRLIPCNLRKRRPLRHSDLYREFESLPLRHTVWVAEKSGCITARISEIAAILQVLLSKRTRENAPPNPARELCGLFSGGRTPSPVSATPDVSHRSLERLLESWSCQEDGIVDAYALKELHIGLDCLIAITDGLRNLPRIHGVAEITVVKHWYNPEWPQPHEPDMILAEFSLDIPYRVQWSAGGNIVDAETLGFSSC